MKRFLIFFALIGLAFGQVAFGDELRYRMVGDVTISRVRERAEFFGKNIMTYNYPGQPVLPYRIIKFLLPPDTDIESVRVSLEDVHLQQLGEWQVEPGSCRFFEASDVPGDDKFRVDGFFPDQLIGDVKIGQLRTSKLATVAVFLSQFDPIINRFFQLSDAEIVVRFDRNPSANSDRSVDKLKPDYIAQKYLKDKVVNFPQSLSLYRNGLSKTKDGGTGYAILTTNAILKNSKVLENFISSKQQRGFQVFLITEDFWGGGIGDAAAENIRKWLKNEYLTRNLEYVLLIGNPHTRLGEVPMKMLWPRNSESIHKESPSDFYYADLSGNWDINANGFCGEYPQDFGPGGVDVNWDVVVGRIPFYGNYDDLDRILEKIIDYENAHEQNISWRNNVLLAMEPLDKWTPGYELGEQIKDYVLSPDGSWNYCRVYEQEYGLDPVPEVLPCNIQNVTNSWKGASFGAVLYATNGTHDKAYDVLDIPHAQQLNDEFPAFTFQCTCYNAYPETAINLSYELLKSGSIATIGATRVSWYARNAHNFNGLATNRGIAFGFFQRLVHEDMSCGYALQDLRQELSFWLNEDWMNLVTFNLYGDPSLSVHSFYINTIPMITLALEVQNGIIRTSSGETANGESMFDFAQGTTIQLYAEPNEGYVFSHWSGINGQLKKNPCTVVMDENLAVQAHFIQGEKATHVCVAALKYKTSPNSDSNFESLLNGIQSAVTLERSPDIIVLPENSLIKSQSEGICFFYAPDGGKFFISPESETNPVSVVIDSICTLAKKFGVNMIVGTVKEACDGKEFKTALVIDHLGDIVGLRRKLLDYAPEDSMVYKTAVQSLGAYTLKDHRNKYFDIFPLLGDDGLSDSSWLCVSGLNADLLVLCDQNGEIDYQPMTEDIFNNTFDPNIPDWQDRIQDIYIQHYVDGRRIIKPADGYLVVADGADASGGLINLNPVPQPPGLLTDFSSILFGLLELVPSVKVSYQFQKAGWYCISVPGEADDMAVDVLFPDAVTGMVLTYENNNYQRADRFQVGKGYWIFFSQPCSTEIQIRPVRHFNRHIAQAGWTLLGSVFDRINFQNPHVTPRGSLALPIKYFDDEQQCYVSSFQLVPTVGYWIENFHECTIWTQADTGLSKIAGKRVAAIPPAPPSMADILPESVIVPKEFHFNQNYPNPFNPETLIEYQLAETCFVKIEVFNIKGERVKTLESRDRNVGRYQVLWRGRNDVGDPVPSGLYFIHIKAGRHSKTIKATLVK
ncbi:T9SS type A sorting domain-containing protein [candidate division KSB1 bacterium]|nr:T9SS type A sorting domain-containing protein [candidate division KSB1 bacterium]